MASEMVARLEIMAKDVHVLTKKCREICVEVQDHFLKELRDLGEQTKVYHHSCYNTNEAHNKLVKSREKIDAARNSTQRRKKALEKEAEVMNVRCLCCDRDVSCVWCSATDSTRCSVTW
jgi:hypothetical protein